MGFPIIGEIWDGIRWIIDFFVSKAPRPVQIMFFLLLLVGAVSLIPFTLHTFGLHCDNEGEVVKTHWYSMITNLRIAFTDADEAYNQTSYTPPTLTFVFIPHTACRLALCNVTGDLYYQSESECIGQPIFYPYITNGDQIFGTIVRPSWSTCITCDGQLRSIQTKIGERYVVCIGDAYPIAFEDMNFYQRFSCTPDESFLTGVTPDRCLPPFNYYYEYDTGTYDCTNPSVCGSNVTAPVRKLDEILAGAGAERYYTDNNDESIDRIISIECNEHLSPTITAWGIPVFDYRLWVLLIVIYIMFMFAFMINRQRN